MANVTFNRVTIRLLGRLYLAQNHNDDLTEKISMLTPQIKRLQKVGLIDDNQQIHKDMIGFAKAASGLTLSTLRDTILENMLRETEERLKGSGKHLTPNYDGLVTFWSGKDVPEDLDRMDGMYWEYTQLLLNSVEANIFEGGTADVRYDLFDLSRARTNLLDVALENLEYFTAEWQATKTFHRCTVRKNDEYVILTVYEYIGEASEIIEAEIDKTMPEIEDDIKQMLIDSVIEDVSMFDSICEEAYHIIAFDPKEQDVRAETLLKSIPALTSKVEIKALEQENNIRTMARYHIARLKQL